MACHVSTGKKIVAIGGGEIRTAGTLAIDLVIIRLSNKKNPSFLFIPTASSDNEAYWNHIDHYYGKKLGCKTEVLYLLKSRADINSSHQKILAADIIYVGGSNTLKMMNLWRKLGVDKWLKSAWERGVVCAGSARGPSVGLNPVTVILWLFIIPSSGDISMSGASDLSMGFIARITTARPWGFHGKNIFNNSSSEPVQPG